MSGPLNYAKSSQGGVSPQQQAYAQYTFGQNEVANATTFGNAGMGMSTGGTQADAGAFANQAYMLGHMSDEDAAAMMQSNQAKTQGAKSGIGSLGSMAAKGGK